MALSVIFLISPASGRAEEPAHQADVLALQTLIQKTIERAEPSIACILVLRSDEYKRFNAAPPDEEAGKLGRFDGSSYTRLFGPRNADKEAEARRLLVKTTLDLSDPDVIPESFGSGVVIDAESGLVLTMAHVIHDATKIYVRLPGGRGSWADVHAADPRSDLAVFRRSTRHPISRRSSAATVRICARDNSCYAWPTRSRPASATAAPAPRGASSATCSGAFPA